jgi:hypothetical protein
MLEPVYYLCSFIFQVLTFSAVVVGVVAIWLQRRALKQQVIIQQAAFRRALVPTLIDRLESSAVRNAARTVHESLPTKPLAEWTAYDRAAAAEVLAAYDIAGTLARHDHVDLDLILAHWAHDLVAVCRACREYITHRRATEGSSYFTNLLWLESEAKKSLADDFNPALTVARAA